MEFVIVSFATYAFTMAITKSDGPFDVFYKLKHSRFEKLFNCFICTSFWVAAVMAIIPSGNLSTWFMLTAAGAGGSIFLDYFGDR